MGQVLALGDPSSGFGVAVSAQVAEQENRAGLCINTHPPAPGKEKKNISLYLDSKPAWFGTCLALQTPELRDQNSCEVGGGHQPHPCAPPGPSPSFPALAGMVRMLQPPLAARHWVQPLVGVAFWAPPSMQSQAEHKGCNQPGFMEKAKIPSCSGH